VERKREGRKEKKETGERREEIYPRPTAWCAGDDSEDEEKRKEEHGHTLWDGRCCSTPVGKEAAPACLGDKVALDVTRPV